METAGGRDYQEDPKGAISERGKDINTTALQNL